MTRRLVFIVAIAAIAVASGLVITSTFDLSRAQTLVKESDDKTPEQVQVVRKLWALAQQGNRTDAEELISVTPKSFYNDRLLCKGSQDSNSRVDKKSLTAVAGGRKDWQYDRLVDLLETIPKKNLTLKDVRLERTAGDEALVVVVYSDPSMEKKGVTIQIQTYFLLVRSDERWRVFSSDETPWLSNKNFAKSRCGETEKQN